MIGDYKQGWYTRLYIIHAIIGVYEGMHGLRMFIIQNSATKSLQDDEAKL